MALLLLILLLAYLNLVPMDMCGPWMNPPPYSAEPGSPQSVVCPAPPVVPK